MCWDSPGADFEFGSASLSAAWLGHASVIARLGDQTVLVDPVLSSRIGVRFASRTLGPPRISPSPVGPAAIKGVDLLLITHAHFDHLDLPTLRALADPRTTVVTAARIARLIPPGFGCIHEITPGESLRVGGLRITAFAPAHWGARRIVDRGRGFNSYLVENDAGRVFFAGDTAYTRSFARVPRPDLAVFGIGAYDPWEHMHATPEQVWSMFQRMESPFLMPVHHSTFELSDEPMHEPMERLLESVGDDINRLAAPPMGHAWSPG